MVLTSEDYFKAIKNHSATIGLKFLVNQMKDAQLNEEFFDDLLRVLINVHMAKSAVQEQVSPLKVNESVIESEEAIQHQVSHFSSTTGPASRA